MSLIPRLEARTCERCGHAFVVAARFTTTICGPCEQARVAQKTVIDRKYLPVRRATAERELRLTTPPREEE